MKCSEIKKYFSEYLDAELSTELTVAVKRHIDTCPECNKEFIMLERTVNAVRGFDSLDPPPDMIVNVNRVIDEESLLKRLWRTVNIFGGHGIPAKAIAVTIVAILVVYLSYKQPPSLERLKESALEKHYEGLESNMSEVSKTPVAPDMKPASPPPTGQKAPAVAVTLDEVSKSDDGSAGDGLDNLEKDVGAYENNAPVSRTKGAPIKKSAAKPKPKKRPIKKKVPKKKFKKKSAVKKIATPKPKVARAVPKPIAAAPPASAKPVKREDTDEFYTPTMFDPQLKEKREKLQDKTWASDDKEAVIESKPTKKTLKDNLDDLYEEMEEMDAEEAKPAESKQRERQTEFYYGDDSAPVEKFAKADEKKAEAVRGVKETKEDISILAENERRSLSLREQVPPLPTPVPIPEASAKEALPESQLTYRDYGDDDAVEIAEEESVGVAGTVGSVTADSEASAPADGYMHAEEAPQLSGDTAPIAEQEGTRAVPKPLMQKKFSPAKKKSKTQVAILKAIKPEKKLSTASMAKPEAPAELIKTGEGATKMKAEPVKPAPVKDDAADMLIGGEAAAGKPSIKEAPASSMEVARNLKEKKLYNYYRIKVLKLQKAMDLVLETAEIHKVKIANRDNLEVIRGSKMLNIILLIPVSHYDQFFNDILSHENNMAIINKGVVSLHLTAVMRGRIEIMYKRAPEEFFTVEIELTL